MHRTHACLTSLVGLSMALLLVGPASAVAADPITIATSPDPIEDAAFQVTLSGSGVANGDAYATIKPSGGRGCGATYSADVGGDDIAYDDSASETFAHVYNQTLNDPGDYLICAWIQDSSSTTTALAATSKTVTVRQPRSTATFAVPARVDAGAALQVAMTVQTEVARRVFVDANAPGIPCGANYQANSGSLDVFYGLDNQGGPASYVANLTAPDTGGLYTLCGYVQESSSDTIAEATFGGQFMVVAPPPPPCVAARKHVASYSAAVRRHKAAAKRYSTRARRAHGHSRRSLKHKATVERRANIRAAGKLASARLAVTRLCPV